MQHLSEFLHLSPDVLHKLLLSLGILLLVTVGRLALQLVLRRRITDRRHRYRAHRALLYAYSVLLILLIGPIWIEGISSLTTFLGLAGAGIAVAMHDTIANIAGWVFIISRKPFQVGDRIQIGSTAGDVVDIRIFQFSLVEIGNWVDADQSTGRIVHVPNSMVLRETLANYQVGFEYIWHEIPVLITFESDWKHAKKLLEDIAEKSASPYSEGVQEQLHKAEEKFFLSYGEITPVVYTTVKDSGVLLTVRYLVNPRERRASEQEIWEATLDAFAAAERIDLAYPTTRFYRTDANLS
ncbi:MAG TPA: mechanosensitive ion channel domain-containing protein [Candidatus Krumholzibacteria bacterium]|nr:mechanosensitive ion channel domain-containing protein [Candidatus Krumholzibacteria bacterium]